MNRPIRLKDMPVSEQPVSEQFRLVAKEWVEADAAASLMEELKTAALESRKVDLIKLQGDMPDNKAERIVKASPEWQEYIRTMCDLRAKAGLLKVKVEWIRMRHSEWMAADANARHERRMA